MKHGGSAMKHPCITIEAIIAGVNRSGCFFLERSYGTKNVSKYFSAKNKVLFFFFSFL